MKKFIFLYLIISGTILFAETNNFPLDAEARIKYVREYETDHLKLEAAISHNAFSDNGWAKMKVKFSLEDEDIGFVNFRLDIERFLLGYKILNTNDSFLAFEMGRAKLEDLFNSKIQFKSYFNGARICYQYNNISLHVAQNVLDRYMHNYGIIGEITYSNFDFQSLALSYSINDWLSHDYIISQLSGEYTPLEIFDNPLTFYGAILKNHCKSSHSNGYYIGLLYGKIEKAKDFLFDVHYQYDGVNTVPYFDYNGIQNGVQLKSIVAISDNFSLQAKMNIAEVDRFECSAIYKW